MGESEKKAPERIAVASYEELLENFERLAKENPNNFRCFYLAVIGQPYFQATFGQPPRTVWLLHHNSLTTIGFRQRLWEQGYMSGDQGTLLLHDKLVEDRQREWQEKEAALRAEKQAIADAKTIKRAKILDFLGKSIVAPIAVALIVTSLNDWRNNRQQNSRIDKLEDSTIQKERRIDEVMSKIEFMRKQIEIESKLSRLLPTSQPTTKP